MKHKRAISSVEVISDSQEYQKWKNDVTNVIEIIKIKQPTLKSRIDEIETEFRSIELDYMVGGRSAFENIETGLRSLYEFVEGNYDEVNSNQLTVDLTHELVAACIKIVDNPVDSSKLDEDGLNRKIRDFLRSALSKFGYLVFDQSQHGISGVNPGEVDLIVYKDEIPVAIYEGLIHKSKEYLYDHIKKAIKCDKYNTSGCKTVYIVEYSRIKSFGTFWKWATDKVTNHPQITNCNEKETGVNGVRMIKGNYIWEDRPADLYYIGVNCPKIYSRPKDGKRATKKKAVEQ